MPAKKKAGGGKKSSGKKKKEEDWGAIAREQYVTIEVHHAAPCCLCPSHTSPSAAPLMLALWQMRNSKWRSMCFKHTMSVSEPVPATPHVSRPARPCQHTRAQLSSSAASRPQVDVLRSVLIEQHELGGSQGLQLFVGESESDEALIKPDDYALPLSSLQLPCGSKNDQIVQVITYTYTPFASILSIPRQVAPAPMKPFEIF